MTDYNTTESQSSDDAEKGHEGEALAKKAIFVEVKYVAIKHRYKEIEPRKETLAHLKKRVLHHFHITNEGPQPDGNTITYWLYHHKKKLENLNETLGDVAGGAEELKLNLVQEITQGRSGDQKELSVLNFADDLRETLADEEASRWKIEQAGPLEMYATVHAIGDPDELFQARLVWDQYPDVPSLKFRDPATGKLDMPTAWPVAYGFRPQSLDACTNWTKEGFALHPDWRTDSRYRWDNSGNIVLRVMRLMQHVLDTSCQGRFK